MTVGGDEFLPADCLANRGAGGPRGDWVALHVALTGMRYLDLLPPDLQAIVTVAGISVVGDLSGHRIEIETRGKGDARLSVRDYATALDRAGVLESPEACGSWNGLTDDAVARLLWNLLADVAQDDAESLGYLPPFKIVEPPETVE